MKRLGSLTLATLLLAVQLPTGAAAQAAPAAPSSPGMPNFGFVSLEVADMARAKAFYVDALGMKPVHTISKPGDPYEKIGYNFSGNPMSDEPLLILIHYLKPNAMQNHSSGTKIGIRVSDSRSAALRIQKAGFPLVRIAAENDTGPVLNSVVHDADGVTVELVQLRLK